MEDINFNQFSTIVYSCATDRQKPHERLIHEHALGCLLAGEMTFQTSKEKLFLKEGDIRLYLEILTSYACARELA
jgi:hypothetical protein